MGGTVPYRWTPQRGHCAPERSGQVAWRGNGCRLPQPRSDRAGAHGDPAWGRDAQRSARGSAARRGGPGPAPAPPPPPPRSSGARPPASSAPRAAASSSSACRRCQCGRRSASQWRAAPPTLSARVGVSSTSPEPWPSSSGGPSSSSSSSPASVRACRCSGPRAVHPLAHTNAQTSGLCRAPMVWLSHASAEQCGVPIARRRPHTAAPVHAHCTLQHRVPQHT